MSIVSAKDNYKGLREAVQCSVPPVIPHLGRLGTNFFLGNDYLGMYQNRLVSLAESMPDFIDGTFHVLRSN